MLLRGPRRRSHLDKSLLEKVQHRFTRLFPELRSFTYNDRLKKLKLWTLEERRNRGDLIELYKMSRTRVKLPLHWTFRHWTFAMDSRLFHY